MSIKSTLLLEAIKRGDINELDKLHLCKQTINCVNLKGDYALHVASELGYTEVLKYLIDKGGNIDLKSKNGNFPIECACRSNQIDTVSLLLQHHCKLNQKDNFSCIYATIKGNYPIVLLLLKAGANPNIKDPDGWGAIFWASQENHIDILSILIDYGAQINCLDLEGKSPLNIAVGENNLNVVNCLLTHGADIDYTGNESPFELACAYQNYSMCNFLLEKGANINYRDKEGRTALFYAKIRGLDQMCNYLLERGASTNIVDTMGISYSDLNDPTICNNLYQELFS